MSNSVELAGIPLSSEDADSSKDSSCKSDNTADESDESPKDTGGSSGNANASVGSAESETSNKDCGEGKFLNPKTGRCKNLQTVSESSTGKTVTTYDPATGEATTEKICNEGYELDKDSNRCKKKKENKGDDFAMEVPELGNKPNFVAIGSVILIAAAGIGFVIFEFRHEIVKFFKKLKARRTPKDML
jgi:hypothetical protein